jgi:hypothetical protein
MVAALVLAVTLFSIRKQSPRFVWMIEIAFGCLGLWYTGAGQGSVWAV